MKGKIRIGAFLLIVFVVVSCDGLLEQEPPNSLLPSEAIRTQQDLEQVLISAYDVLANTYNGDAQNMANLLADHVARPAADARYESIWLRSSTIFNNFSNPVFSNFYIAVLRSNTVLENLENVSNISEVDQNRIAAEARFVRALCHFDVVRLYAHPYGFTPGNSHPGVAIRSSSDVENSVISRSTVGEVFNFILEDITFAKENLPVNNGIFATKDAALALEAAVKFQMQDYESVYALTTEIIESGQNTFSPANVNQYTFPDPSSEAIFYIASTPLTGTTIDSRNGGFRGQWNTQGNTPNLRVTQEFYSQITQFGGPRSDLFLEINQDGSIFYATSKFNEQNFQIPIFTTTQMMLLRAESAAELQTNLDVAIADINMIRQRAYGFSGNNLLETASAQEVLDAAREELWFELPFTGQRIHDLRRRGAQGENIEIRGASWDCDGMLLQFPATEATSAFAINPGGGC